MMRNEKLTIAEMNRLTPEAFHSAKKLPIVVVLDNVRSQHNVGAVFRTADAFLLEGIYLCGICCCPPNVEIHKTALGAENTVSWRYFSRTIEAVELLHKRGYKVYAIEQAHRSIPLQEAVAHIDVNNPYAVIMGHEVFGVQQEIIEACDGCIEIPQYGTKHSLNVSVTAGIVLYQLSTAMREQQS